MRKAIIVIIVTGSATASIIKSIKTMIIDETNKRIHQIIEWWKHRK